MDTESEQEWHKSKDKEMTQLFWNKFNATNFTTQFFFPTCYLLVQVIEGKII